MRNAKRAKETGRRIRRHLIPVITAVLVMAIATFAVLALRPTPSGVPALVALTDLRAGEPVTNKTASVFLLPKTAVPDEAVSSFAQTDGEDIRRDVARGEVLLLRDFTDNTSGVPPGRSRVVLDLPADSDGLKTGEVVQIWGSSDACLAPDSPIEKLASDAVVEQVNEVASAAFQGDADARVSFLMASSEVAQVLCASTQSGLHIVVAGP
ncbi:hypothetical protein U6G28_01015 [Actinomycetaceae bacterium MB13-C1-2]|nr:hypothetical protein U6G28_01015 [Actinomycetaceae bacterium MB13-C1-2]